jgi:hypothetical protein
LQIPASASLEWTPCYDGFDCAKLLVPLDYTDRSIGNTTVAFIRVKGPGNALQDILLNPVDQVDLTSTAFLIVRKTTSCHLGFIDTTLSVSTRGASTTAAPVACATRVTAEPIKSTSRIVWRLFPLRGSMTTPFRIPIKPSNGSSRCARRPAQSHAHFML